MKYALIGEKRRVAETGLVGDCPVCGSVMIAKCGEVRGHHWAHRGIRTCDHWWEPETDWHWAWKDLFPADWQEFVQRAEAGERHIADVRTELGFVLEFQHSYLRPGERRARESFYERMAWIVDGRRRKRDQAKFLACLDASAIINRQPDIASAFDDESALLRDWSGSRVPAYFDFGVAEARQDLLWRRSPFSPGGDAYLTLVPRDWFIRAHLTGADLEDRYIGIERELAYRRMIRITSHSVPLPGYQRYLARKNAVRRRF
jgi:competence protein CoiA